MVTDTRHKVLRNEKKSLIIMLWSSIPRTISCILWQTVKSQHNFTFLLQINSSFVDPSLKTAAHYHFQKYNFSPIQLPFCTILIFYFHIYACAFSLSVSLLFHSLYYGLSLFKLQSFFSLLIASFYFCVSFTPLSLSAHPVRSSVRVSLSSFVFLEYLHIL